MSALCQALTCFLGLWRDLNENIELGAHKSTLIIIIDDDDKYYYYYNSSYATDTFQKLKGEVELEYWVPIPHLQLTCLRTTDRLLDLSECLFLLNEH